MAHVMMQWRTKLFCGDMFLGAVRIRHGIFQGDSFSPLLFIMCLFPLMMILRRCSSGYRLGSKNVIVNHLLYLDDLNFYGRNRQEI